MDKEIGKVIHYFNKVQVAVIKLEDDLKLGDIIKVVHGQREFNQKVESMQVDHESVPSREAGEEVAIKVKGKAPVGARIYRIEE